jgi:protocatechuate 3,4-dioxygenase beta subunit
MAAGSSTPRVALAQAAAGTMPACIMTPEQTEGPYFVDERLNRSDIRMDPSDGSVRTGIPLALKLRVSSVGSNGCVPLAGAIVDLWHCDAAGLYSDTVDLEFNTMGKKFLRGYQVTDAKGYVQFITIFPGWYPGRAVHMHFKVRAKTASAASGASHELTSQLYFDDAVTDRVQARKPYAGRGSRTVRNDRDGIFRQGGRQLMVALREGTDGYSGAFDIGLRIA